MIHNSSRVVTLNMLAAEEGGEGEEEAGRRDMSNLTGDAPTFLMKTSFELQQESI